MKPREIMKYVLVTVSLFLAGCGQLYLPNGGTVLPDSLVAHDRGLLSADKGQHFLAGMGVAHMARAIVRETKPTWDRKEQMIAGCAASATAGIAKELSDKYIVGTRFETADAVYTAAGCLFTFEWVF